VYIAEAHAADEWPVGTRISCCNQTRTVEERVQLAKTFCTETGLAFPVLVDTMANTFMDAFAAWPFRYYVIRAGKVACKPMPHEGNHFGYDVKALGKWLGEHAQ